MPKYVFHNPTPCRIFIPGPNIWIGPKKNRVIHSRASLLANDEINDLVLSGHLRMEETVESPTISDHIEIPVVDMLDGIASGITPGDIRMDITLAGAVDGVNMVFTAPDTFIQDPPNTQIAVYLNGQRLTEADDFTVSGGGVGEGTTVTLTHAPLVGDKVYADYVVA